MKCIILVPYPAQGHVTPMLKLASALTSHGFTPVVVIPEFIHCGLVTNIESRNNDIKLVSIPDGLEKESQRDFFAIEMAMENHMPVHLERLVRKLGGEDGGIACVVVDLVASWAIKVANQCGVPVAGFWPAMGATYRLITAIPDMVRNGIISETGTPMYKGPISFLPGQTKLNADDLPWLIGSLPARNGRFKFWSRTLERLRNLQWLLVNTFPDECYNNIQNNQFSDISDHSPCIIPVGPLNNYPNIVNNASFCDEDTSCLEWLDKQSPGSAVYICFGSWVSPIGEAKVKNLALALEASGRPFVWVLGLSWRKGLPVDYIERASRQGKVVSWAPQIEVLQHKALGCYLTHCGWNSTMEAIQCKKPLLCYPIAGDQFVNCAYIVSECRIGVKLNGFSHEDVEDGIKRVLEDTHIKQRIMTLNERIMGKESISKAMAHLTGFVEDLKELQADQPLIREY